MLLNNDHTRHSELNYTTKKGQTYFEYRSSSQRKVEQELGNLKSNQVSRIFPLLTQAPSLLITTHFIQQWPQMSRTHATGKKVAAEIVRGRVKSGMTLAPGVSFANVLCTVVQYEACANFGISSLPKRIDNR